MGGVLRRAGRQCRGAGCNQIVYGKGKPYCEACLPLYVKNDYLRRGSPKERGYDHNWKKLRDMFLNAHPLCADPFGFHQGQPVIATDVDHIKPKAKGGTDDDNNLQSLCHSCHSHKTVTFDGGFGRASVKQ